MKLSRLLELCALGLQLGNTDAVLHVLLEATEQARAQERAEDEMADRLLAWEHPGPGPCPRCSHTHPHEHQGSKGFTRGNRYWIVAPPRGGAVWRPRAGGPCLLCEETRRHYHEGIDAAVVLEDTAGGQS